MLNLPYYNLRSEESCGTYGAFGIKIEVAASKLPNLNNEAIWTAGHKAVELVKAAVMEAVIAADPEAQERAKNEKEELLALFPKPIFVEPIPNGYCSSWCCKHLPWFIVTTEVGKIKIGWRKRVINIDWSQCVGVSNANGLFPNEDVTKEDKLIHAWGYEKAKQYINAIITNTTLKG